LDIPSSSPCSLTICAAYFPLTNLQLHKSALPISLTVGMAASTLRACFGQPAKACTSCTFDTVTLVSQWKRFIYTFKVTWGFSLFLLKSCWTSSRGLVTVRCFRYLVCAEHPVQRRSISSSAIACMRSSNFCHIS
jgi:hypothetical protein